MHNKIILLKEAHPFSPTQQQYRSMLRFNLNLNQIQQNLYGKTFFLQHIMLLAALQKSFLLTLKYCVHMFFFI